MKEELITFETAILSKEKGFDWGTYYLYNASSECERSTILEPCNWNTDWVSAPTQSLLQKWLREKKEIYVCVESGYDSMLGYNRGFNLDINGTPILNADNDVFSTYEQALEAGLQEALKLLP